MGWNYLSVPKLQCGGAEQISNFIPSMFGSKLIHISKMGPKFQLINIHMFLDLKLWIWNNHMSHYHNRIWSVSYFDILDIFQAIYLSLSYNMFLISAMIFLVYKVPASMVWIYPPSHSILNIIGITQHNGAWISKYSVIKWAHVVGG